MPGCLDKKSKFGRNEFLRLGSWNILKFFRVDQFWNAWEGKNMEKKKGINRHAAGLCAGLGILFAAAVPMTAFADTVYVNASKLNYRNQPSTASGAVLGTLPRGTELSRVKNNGEWSEVQIGGAKTPLSDHQQAAEQHCENGGGNCGRNIHSCCRWNCDSPGLLKGVCG